MKIPNPALNLTQLICGTVLIVPSVYTFYKVWKGSQSTFAYIMLILSLLTAIKFIAWVITNLYPTEVMVCETYNFVNFYAFIILCMF